MASRKRIQKYRWPVLRITDQIGLPMSAILLCVELAATPDDAVVLSHTTG